MKPLLYIHIGQHRTGTTSLQNFLASNRKVLYDKGIIYPKFLKPASSHFFAWYYGFGNRRLNDIEKSQVKDILRSIRCDAIKNSKDILISSEILFSGITRSKLVKIRKQFSDFDLKIICYLRRQDRYILSFYTQFLKNRKVLDMESYINKKVFRWYHSFYLPGYNWYKKLKSYSSIFGKENLIVKPFERHQLKDGDIITDFVNILGISRDMLVFPDKMENTSLPPEGLYILRYLNFMMKEKISSAEIKNGMLEISELLEKYYRRDEYQKNTFLSTKTRKKILKRFDKTNQKIAKKFLDRDKGILFFDTNEEECNDTLDFSQFDHNDIIKRFVEILINQHQEIKYLKRK